MADIKLKIITVHLAVNRLLSAPATGPASLKKVSFQYHLSANNNRFAFCLAISSSAKIDYTERCLSSARDRLTSDML